MVRYDRWWQVLRTPRKIQPRRLKLYPVAELVDLKGLPGQLVETGDGVMVACGQGGLKLAEVQPDGGRRMRALDWRRGWRTAGEKALH